MELALKTAERDAVSQLLHEMNIKPDHVVQSSSQNLMRDKLKFCNTSYISEHTPRHILPVRLRISCRLLYSSESSKQT